MRVPWTQGEWSRALVYGLGVSGRAAVRLLRRHGVKVVAIDRRPADELDLGGLATGDDLALVLGTEPEALPLSVDGVVVSPGVPTDRPLLLDARERGVPVISEIELAFPLLNGPAVGITGSNGKSTTTALAGSVLSAAGRAAEVCGNIGVPLASCVEGEPGRVFVIEVSSFQLESVDTFRPHAAALLNLTADHLDRHVEFEHYRAAKEAIFARQGPEDVAVLNADDPLVAATAARARRRFFSRRRPVEDGCYLDGERVLEAAPGLPPVELFRRDELRLHGLHNLENAMAAALLTRALGIDSAGVRSGLTAFAGLPHRLERIALHRGIAWFNDSKGTNIDATLRSLEGFADGSVHLILGGRHKGGDPRSLAPAIARKARHVYLIGEAADEFGRALEGAARCEWSGDLDGAVAAAGARAADGETVLLSPACASFDQYENFARRGDHFNRLVRDITGGADG